jgi:hypothetical protein
MKNTVLLLAFAFMLGCTGPETEQQKAENAALSYIQTNYKGSIVTSDTASFTTLKKMEGYSEGVKLPVFYRFFYNGQVQDSTGAVSEKKIEIKLDSALKVTEVVIPQEEDFSFTLE